MSIETYCMWSGFFFFNDNWCSRLLIFMSGPFYFRVSIGLIIAILPLFVAYDSLLILVPLKCSSFYLPLLA